MTENVIPFPRSSSKPHARIARPAPAVKAADGAAAELFGSTMRATESVRRDREALGLGPGRSSVSLVDPMAGIRAIASIFPDEAS